MERSDSLYDYTLDEDKGEINSEMDFIFGFLAAVVLWLSPIIWAWVRNHENKKLITFITLFFGPLGFLIALLIISNKKIDPEHWEAGVYSCEHCGTPYRLSDYREDADIYCDMCKKRIARNIETANSFSSGARPPRELGR